MPAEHNCRSTRLRGYDYARAGIYFVTTFADDRECLFGEIRHGIAHPNTFGEIVRQEWLRTATVRPNVRLDEFIVMPNHFHGILVIPNTPGMPRKGEPTVRSIPGANSSRANHRFALATNDSMPRAPASGSVGAVMMQFKSIVAKRINALRGTLGNPIWHRNYHDHIIHNEREYHAIVRYIRQNPAQWSDDPSHPSKIGRSAVES